MTAPPHNKIVTVPIWQGEEMLTRWISEPSPRYEGRLVHSVEHVSNRAHNVMRLTINFMDDEEPT